MKKVGKLDLTTCKDLVLDLTVLEVFLQVWLASGIEVTMLYT